MSLVDLPPRRAREDLENVIGSGQEDGAENVNHDVEADVNPLGLPTFTRPDGRFPGEQFRLR